MQQNLFYRTGCSKLNLSFHSLLVEDGLWLRFTHYNLKAKNCGLFCDAYFLSPLYCPSPITCDWWNTDTNISRRNVQNLNTSAIRDRSKPLSHPSCSKNFISGGDLLNLRKHPYDVIVMSSGLSQHLPGNSKVKTESLLYQLGHVVLKDVVV